MNYAGKHINVCVVCCFQKGGNWGSRVFQGSTVFSRIFSMKAILTALVFATLVLASE